VQFCLAVSLLKYIYTCVCVGRVYKYKTTTGGKILFPALNIINALYILGVGVGSSSSVC
jgi:hypothetical protein